MAPEVLVLRHAPWEGLGAFAHDLEARGQAWRYVDLFRGEAVPNLSQAHAVVIMGGPMSVSDRDRHPFLDGEIAAIKLAAQRQTRILGVCLGSQLLAAALGAAVHPNPRGKEIGWASVRREPPAEADPIFRLFSDNEIVLHWHGDLFEMPEGAVSLTRSDRTPCQAFRWESKAWGILFHVEADPALVSAWLSEPSMRAEATALDPALPERIAAEAPAHQGRLGQLRSALLDALLS